MYAHLGTFSIGKWFAECCAFNSGLPQPWLVAMEWLGTCNVQDVMLGFPAQKENYKLFCRESSLANSLELGGVQVNRNKHPFLQRNSAQIKGNGRILPSPMVVKVEINNHPVRTLLDYSLLGDFMLSTLVNQLSITHVALDTPLSLHLAVQGSRSKVNARATVHLRYQDIKESHTLDIINLN